MIYLDIAATAGYKETDDIIIETMTNAMKTLWQNPSSLYSNNIKKVIDKCRFDIGRG